MLLATVLLACGLALQTALAAPTLWGNEELTPFKFSSELVSANDFHLCPRHDPKDDLFTITRAEISPDPPKQGEELHVELEGELKTRLEQGSTIHLTVKMNKFIQLLKKDFDLCEQVKAVGAECPLEKGPISLSGTFDIPRGIPPAVYTAFAEITDQDGQHVICEVAEYRF
ncbi:hypothetical protein RI367_007469 [Sorochytrium milnesiophthora]